MAAFYKANYSNFTSYIIKIMLNYYRKKKTHAIIYCGYNGVWLVNSCSSEYLMHEIEHGTHSELFVKLSQCRADTYHKNK